MTMLLRIFFLLVLTKLFIANGFDITHRVEYNLVGVSSNSNEENYNPTDKLVQFSTKTNDRCIAVEATKELGCLMQARTNLFQGFFGPICERHQLCYKCGFAFKFTPWLCDQMANEQMYEECAKNLDSPEMRYTCIRERLAAMKLLKQNTYQQNDPQSEFTFECQQKCVAYYLLSAQ